MTPSNAVNSENKKEAKLSRQDRILLLLLSLLTICLIFGFTKLVARWVFPFGLGRMQK